MKWVPIYISLVSRLKVEYTYSLQNVEDQIFYVPVDGATGYQEMLTNAGKMRTHAHELSINTAILQAKRLRPKFRYQLYES